MKQSGLYALLVLASSAVWIVLGSSGLLDGIDQEVMRWRYLARGEIETKDNIVYVDLDAETVSYMGHRPWDRREFGRVLAALLGPGGARTVAVDIIFSKYGASTMLDLDRARKGDFFLGQIVEKYKDKVVLAAAYTGVINTLAAESADRLPLIRDGNYDPETNTFPEAPTFPIINLDVGRLGIANVDEALSRGPIPLFVPAFIEFDSPRYSFLLMDGLTRHFSLVLNEELRPAVLGDQVTIQSSDGWFSKQLPLNTKTTLFSLGLEAFLVAHGLGRTAVEFEGSTLSIRMSEEETIRIPLVQSQSIEVNWFEGWDTSQGNERVSMREVLERADALAKAANANDTSTLKTLREWFSQFNDKVIFLGPVDPQLKDIAPTPFNRVPVPKVLLHANVFRTIESGEFILRVSSLVSALSVLLLTVGVACLALGNRWLRICSVGVFIGYIGFVFVVFSSSNLVLPLVSPVGSALTATIFVILIRIGSEEWQRRRIKNLFGAYVSPSLVNDMVESHRDPELGGTEAEVTALFSDVEGFSSLSEELKPNELVALMNEYLGEMTETFQAEQGTLDKYIGDAIVTMFGMPYPVDDHAARACRSALAMQERHAALREQWREDGKWPEKVLQMRTRIGINTGVAVIGNMGSEMRFNYTMMGDSVNLAARCESGAKSYGVYTMVTASTLEAALRENLELHYRKLDRVVVKGRSRPVEIYELWDASYDLTKARSCRAKYEQALQAYFDGDWENALLGFEASSADEPGQEFAPITPSELLAERCREFIKNGSPENWDGVYRMKTK
ncbi:MAG: adenylate/guanylate cyclase domain-containing protein [Verrucomicrobiota bacterium]